MRSWNLHEHRQNIFNIYLYLARVYSSVLRVCQLLLHGLCLNVGVKKNNIFKFYHPLFISKADIFCFVIHREAAEWKERRQGKPRRYERQKKQSAAATKNTPPTVQNFDNGATASYGGKLHILIQTFTKSVSWCEEDKVENGFG